MSSSVSRRNFGRVLVASTAAATLPGRAFGDVQAAPSREFPQGFLWGSATASYQVEGAVAEDGRGPSIWDTFSHTAGKTANGDSGDVSADYYHRYGQDIGLMKDLGLKGFRFSVAWSRIFPEGTGQPNIAGVDFYRAMVAALLEAGIEPYCTLYHWDLPQALQDKGGWENRDTAQAMADYAGYFAGKLSDLVTRFMTMNEIRTFVELGHGRGTHAPGLRLNQKRIAQLTHNVVLAHGMSVQAIRASTGPDTKVGIADNITTMVPVVASPPHIEAARRALREENAMFLTVVLEGRYTDRYLKRLGPAAPKFTEEEMAIVRSPLDFVGINIYQPTWVRDDPSDAGYALVDPPTSYPHMLSEWLTIGPEALYWGPRLAAEIWDLREIYITENGTSSADVPAADGQVWDTDRVMYLRNYLQQLQRAIEDGVPVKGYFLWSLLDNFEWADGYEKRFGIVYVDFKTQKRTPKLSAAFYKQVVQTNRVA